MVIFNPFRAHRGARSALRPWGADARDHVPTVSSRLTSHWSPDPDGHQVWRWSVVAPAHT
jgi:hypothetical protein